VVVLTYKFWRRHYNASPDILGRTLQLVHKTYIIVGVAQPRFTWGDADVYLPLKLSQDPTVNYGVPVKLKPGVSRAAANAELQALFTQFAKETPAHFPPSFHVAIKGLNDPFVDELGHTLFLFTAGARFVDRPYGGAAV
jgi:putative ABC transport system permease protein